MGQMPRWPGIAGPHRTPSLFTLAGPVSPRGKRPNARATWRQLIGARGHPHTDCEHAHASFLLSSRPPKLIPSSTNDLLAFPHRISLRILLRMNSCGAWKLETNLCPLDANQKRPRRENAGAETSVFSIPNKSIKHHQSLFVLVPK